MLVDTAFGHVQFLPQDKVVEFAKMKPNELLLETEKAIGDAHLFKLHQELVEQRTAVAGIEQVLFSSQLHLVKDL